LAIYFQQSLELPLLVAANRDELLARPTAEPRVIATDPWLVAGQDLSAGGTWLGVNEHRMVVGLLNRRDPAGPDPSRRSRGLLCLQALSASSPSAAIDRVLRERAADYNRFNLLAADGDRAFLVSNQDGEMKITALRPGIHVLTNSDLNDVSCPRIAKSRAAFASVPLPTRSAETGSLIPRLREILSDHAAEQDGGVATDLESLCVHAGPYGTRSSTILACFAPPDPVLYWHAPGPPCRTEYSRVPLPNFAVDRLAARD
jgi:uncharacterized protein with NRDE domain